MAQLHIKDVKELERFQQSLGTAIKALDGAIRKLRGDNGRLKGNWPDRRGQQFTSDVEKIIGRLQRDKARLESQLPKLRSTIADVRRIQGM